MRKAFSTLSARWTSRIRTPSVLDICARLVTQAPGTRVLPGRGSIPVSLARHRDRPAALRRACIVGIAALSATPRRRKMDYYRLARGPCMPKGEPLGSKASAAREGPTSSSVSRPERYGVAQEPLFRKVGSPARSCLRDRSTSCDPSGERHSQPFRRYLGQGNRNYERPGQNSRKQFPSGQCEATPNVRLSAQIAMPIHVEQRYSRGPPSRTRQ